MKLTSLVLICALVQCIVGDTRIATLYRFDPIACTFSFTYGTPGYVFDSNDVFNYNSDIDYGNYNSGYLATGIEGARVGKMVDLGTQTALAAEYSYYETVGYGQGYASIRFASNTSSQLVIRDNTQNGVQNLVETTQLYGTPSSQEYLYPYVDHVILIRITDTNDANFEKVVKMLILSVDYDYITFRYDVLRDTTTGPAPTNGTSRIVDMYSYDDLSRTLSFGWGFHGLCFCEAYTCDYCDLCNCNSDLDFDWYGASSITSGIEGGTIANIVDVGTESDNEYYYGLNVNYYASIRLNGSSLIVGAGTSYDLRNESGALFSQPSPYYLSRTVYREHIYLVRILDSFDATFERIVKLKLVAVDGDVRITVRYDILKDTHPQQSFWDRTNNGTFITTLYASDPEIHSFDFRKAASGGIIQDGTVYNRGSDIDFNNYMLGGLSVGIEGGEKGLIYDLGSPLDIIGNYANQIQLYDGFASLYYNISTTDTVVVNRTMQYPLDQNAFFKTNNESFTGASIYENHVYFVRLWDDNDPQQKTVVKILILRYVPDEEVTFRWVRLSDYGSGASSSPASVIAVAFTFLLATILFV